MIHALVDRFPHDRPPPEMLLSEYEPFRRIHAVDEPLRPALAAVPSTLAIPLAARAFGGELFPHLAVDDVVARRGLALIGDDGRRWLTDRSTVYGVLARTVLFRELATGFFERHPRGHGVNLGCGLSHPFQWLDNGCNEWRDIDLPAVAAIRQRLALPESPRRLDLAVDIGAPGWWDAAGLAATRSGPPLLMMCEGVLMYLDPAQVRALLRTFAERAPAGSELLLDAMPWLAIGHAHAYPSVHETGAQFSWGLRRVADLAQAHERLALHEEHDVMAGYGFPHAWVGPVFRWFSGVPFYGVYRLGLRT